MSARSAGKGLSIIVVPEHHESADNDHGGVSEANDSCWQQNPAEVQQNSSKWGQRIGWTVSKSTRVRWGTRVCAPHAHSPLSQHQQQVAGLLDEARRRLG